MRRFALVLMLLATPTLAAPLSPDDVVKAAPKSDWQEIDPANTLYMDLPTGRVVIALAPGFAPQTSAHIKSLAHARYFDGKGAIVRVQDNYVAQWGDPENRHPLPKGIGEEAHKK